MPGARIYLHRVNQDCNFLIRVKQGKNCQKIVKNYEKENIGNIGQKAQLAKLPQCLHHRKT
jgi:hypothetical protein